MLAQRDSNVEWVDTKPFLGIPSRHIGLKRVNRGGNKSDMGDLTSKIGNRIRMISIILNNLSQDIKLLPYH